MTVLEALKSVNGYPIPNEQIESISLIRGLDITYQVDKEILTSREFELAKADVLMWVSFAPNVSEGGVSVSGLKSDDMLRNKAIKIYKKHGDDLGISTYGYKGENL